MIIFRIFLVLIFNIFSICLYGQSVDILPQWNKDEIISFTIKSSTKDFINEKVKNYNSIFDANFIVKDINEHNVTIIWTYANAVIDPNDPVLENNILGKLVNIPLKIRLTDIGQFSELINDKEVLEKTKIAVEELIKNEKNPSLLAEYKAAKEMINSKISLEIAILKHVKQYLFSFGCNFTLNKKVQNAIQIANPFGGKPFDGIENVEMMKLNKADSICSISTNKFIDANVLTRYVKALLLKSNPEKSVQIEKMYDDKTLEFSEKTQQEINYKKGILEYSSYVRTANFGVQNRVNTIEITKK